MALLWPPDYSGELRRRMSIWRAGIANPKFVETAKLAYAADPVMFVNDCVWVYEPRAASAGDPTKLPAVPFPRQAEFLVWMKERFETKTSAPVEKSRDSGATWMASAFAVWMWLFHPGSVVGFGSRKEILVDRIGDMQAIFPKIRNIIDHLPPWLVPENWNPKVHSNYMRIVNPENDAAIVGEAGNNIGRGGRSSVYFVDEAAYLDHPESVEAALTANTDCRIDISSPCVGTLFSTWCASSTVKFTFDVFDIPWHDEKWVSTKRNELEGKGLGHIFRREYLRDATAGIQGQLISSEWVEAAVAASKRLDEIKIAGEKVAGLDVADGGTDQNALTIRHGVLVLSSKARPDLLADGAGMWAYDEATRAKCAKLLYDSIGVGAGAAASLRARKADRDKAVQGLGHRVERIAAYLRTRAARPKSLITLVQTYRERDRFTIVLSRKDADKVRITHRPYPEMTIAGWNAADSVVNPNGMYEGNRTNADMFANAKAQSWWMLRDRFYKTYQWIVQGKPIDLDEIIVLSPDIPQLRDIKTELAQITYKHNPSGKVIINKAPDGHRSPNLADSIMISFAPTARGVSVIGVF